jgi:hypothetical protein
VAGPIYPSPFRDFGYDISEFCAVDPMYGTLADFDRVVERLHGSGMSLLLDVVPNYTSDTHPWSARAALRGMRPSGTGTDEPGWRATQQLAQPLRRQRRGMARTERPILTTTPSDEIGVVGVNIPTQPHLRSVREARPRLWRQPAIRNAFRCGGRPTSTADLRQPWLPVGNDVAARNVQTAKPIAARSYAWWSASLDPKSFRPGAGLLRVDRARPQTAFERTQARQ